MCTVGVMPVPEPLQRPVTVVWVAGTVNGGARQAGAVGVAAGVQVQWGELGWLAGHAVVDASQVHVAVPNLQRVHVLN